MGCLLPTGLTCQTAECWEFHRQQMIRSLQTIGEVRARTPMDMLSSLNFVMGQVTTFAQEELNESFTAVVHPGHMVFGQTFEQWGQQNCGGRLDYACLQSFQSMSSVQSLGNSLVTALELTTPLGLVVEGYACAANMTVAACATAAASAIPTGALVRLGGKVFIRSGDEVLEVTVEVSGGTRTVADIAPVATTRTATRADVAESFQQNRAFWTSEPVQFNGNRVFQRNDLIDPTRIDPETGRTNLELMRAGRAPIGPDGYPVNLHHLTQSQSGAIAEMTQTLHRTNHGILHMPNTVPSGINRTQFNAWRRDYWRNRASDFSGG